MERKRILRGPCGVKLILDRDEFFPDDPGNGTPALVEYKGGTGTYGCVCDNGVVDTWGRGDIELPQEALEWLNSDEVSLAVEWAYS